MPNLMQLSGHLLWKDLISKEKERKVDYFRNHWDADGTPKIEDPYDNIHVSPLHATSRVLMTPEFQIGRGDVGLKRALAEKEQEQQRLRQVEQQQLGLASASSPELRRLPSGRASPSRSPTATTARSILRSASAAGGGGASVGARSLRSGSQLSGIGGMSDTASLRSEIRRQVEEELTRAFKPAASGMDRGGGVNAGQRLTQTLLWNKSQEREKAQSSLGGTDRGAGQKSSSLAVQAVAPFKKKTRSDAAPSLHRSHLLNNAHLEAFDAANGDPIGHATFGSTSAWNTLHSHENRMG